ncbi:MAG: hypothetical protein HOE90_12470 [Bacteriovoracaceae bacterium]|jgi:hypothetical protein|nr:hypothetical protein [Bacteriovoracaceae bacterium]
MKGSLLIILLLISANAFCNPFGFASGEQVNPDFDDSALPMTENVKILKGFVSEEGIRQLTALVLPPPVVPGAAVVPPPRVPVPVKINDAETEDIPLQTQRLEALIEIFETNEDAAAVDCQLIEAAKTNVGEVQINNIIIESCQVNVHTMAEPKPPASFNFGGSGRDQHPETESLEE